MKESPLKVEFDNDFTNPNLDGQRMVILDEGSQVSTIADGLIWQLRIKHLICAGDHKQLQPLVISDSIKRSNMIETVTAQFANAEPSTTNKFFLDEQKRMESTLLELPNNLIYSGEIHPKTEEAPVWLRGIQEPLGVFNIVNSKEEKIETPTISWINPKEADILLCAVKALLRLLNFTEYFYENSGAICENIDPVVLKDNAFSIGIMTFYAGQKSYIERLGESDPLLSPLRTASSEHFSIITVDSAMGRTFDAVFLSMVRTEKFGFIGGTGRFNVSITRARHLRLIFSNQRLLNAEIFDTTTEAALAKEYIGRMFQVFVQNGICHTVINKTDETEGEILDIIKRKNAPYNLPEDRIGIINPGWSSRCFTLCSLDLPDHSDCQIGKSISILSPTLVYQYTPSTGPCKRVEIALSRNRVPQETNLTILDVDSDQAWSPCRMDGHKPGLFTSMSRSAGAIEP